MKERAYLFYQWSLPDISRHFEVDFKTGLAKKDITGKLRLYNLNTLNLKEESRVLKILFRQFLNLFVYILIVAAIISYFIDGLFQAVILIAIILANVVLGFIQEFKAEKALSALKNQYKSKSLVLRDGKINHILSEELVPGDVVLLEAGDKVPADIRVIKTNNLKVNESALTGESLPVSKEDKVFPIDTPLPDRANMLYASTLITSGNAQGVVIATGVNTEFGKVANLIDKAEEKTPLEKKIIYLSKLITYFSVALLAAIFVLGLWRGYSFLPLLNMVIALLVGAVPESLPTIITLALAIGVSKMASKKAIVRRMAVIESLGTTNVIATDKTGTLTNNHLVLEKIFTYEEGRFEEMNPGENRQGIISFLSDAVLCTNLNFNRKYIGDPLDVAIAERLSAIHEDKVLKAITTHKIMELPFDSREKYSAVRVSDGGHDHILAKGAAEAILKFCSVSESRKKDIIKTAESLSSEGLKVIALAKKEVSSSTGTSFIDFRFCGLLAFVDEPAPGVKDAIAEVISAGIRPIIITGDHAQTAKFIANRIGMEVSDDQVVTSTDLNILNKQELKKVIDKVKIFARVSPEEKIKIVKLLNDLGYSVTVTGDGVNDAPALKEASVGISMGKKGTDIAREASDIVLSDDSYSTIVTAIEYGRGVYDNIKNSITFLLSGNIAEVFLIAMAFIFDLPVPLITIQILWINLVTDSLPALAMAFEDPNPEVMREKPRPKKENSMKGALIYASYLAIVGLVFSFGLYLWGLKYSILEARTIIFTALVLIELVFALSVRSVYRFWQRPRSFFTNKYLLLAVTLSLGLQFIIFLPQLRGIFKITLLNGEAIWAIIIVSILTFVAAELIRFYYDRYSNKKE